MFIELTFPRLLRFAAERLRDELLIGVASRHTRRPFAVWVRSHVRPRSTIGTPLYVAGLGPGATRKTTVCALREFEP